MITLTFFLKHEMLPRRLDVPDTCEVVIGRGDGPTLDVAHNPQGIMIRCPVGSLSEQHARLSIVDGRVRVEDLRSRNGTMIRLEPGRPHDTDDKAIWLGPDVTMRVEDDRWSLPDTIGSLSPRDLQQLLAQRLAPRGVEVEIGTPGADTFPVVGSAEHVVLRPASATRTIDVDDTSWVRFVVSAYNAARDATHSDNWQFTAVSAVRRRALDQARRAARAHLPILLLGPTGVGKEILAHGIHDHSPNRGGNFVAINCATLSSERLESELFGHARGAFTGAHVDREGLVELAADGTLFLDEIGEMSASVQARLLRFLADGGEYRRMGESRIRRSTARIVAATHRDLRRDDGVNSFRDDLFYRLAGVRIDVPAPRPEDLERIAASILADAVRDHRRTIGEDTVRLIARDAAQRAWPGNVRQLRFAIERCVQMFEPSLGWLENWRASVAFDEPAASMAVKAAPVVSAQPLRVGRLLADALFLRAAEATRTRAELARSLSVTYQAVDSRLAALRLDLGQPAEITARRAECIAELRALAAGVPDLGDVLRSVLEP